MSSDYKQKVYEKDGEKQNTERKGVQSADDTYPMQLTYIAVEKTCSCSSFKILHLEQLKGAMGKSCRGSTQ